MRVKLRHLEVFNALIEAGSVSRAAVRLNLTQPAVSIALSNLEADLGFPLFHRDRGFFAPTSEAMLLHDEVTQGLMALARVEQRAGEIRAGAAGGISLATNGVLSVHFLPRHIAARGRGAGLSPEIFRMECVCILRESDPLAARETVTPEALSGRPVIGITGDHSLDRQLERAMIAADTPLDRTASGYYYPIVRNLVAAGDGVAVIDPINGKAVLGDGVTWRPFAPRIVHELAMITARDHPLGNAAAAFQARIRAELAATSIP